MSHQVCRCRDVRLGLDVTFNASVGAEFVTLRAPRVDKEVTETALASQPPSAANRYKIGDFA